MFNLICLILNGIGSWTSSYPSKKAQMQRAAAVPPPPTPLYIPGDTLECLGVKLVVSRMVYDDYLFTNGVRANFKVVDNSPDYTFISGAEAYC